MNEQKIIQWIGALSIPGIGPTTFWKMLKATKTLPEVDGAFENYQKHINNGVSIIAEFDDRYPKGLKKLHDSPPIIYTKGDSSILKKRFIAIVGARNASIASKKFTENLANELVEAGFAVISGLARGIDASAHIGGIKQTCAVIAGGIDQIYPKENEKLFKIIEEKGCIISEDPIGVRPAAPLFPRRNRIIAALSDAVIVIEAALKSGSLITCKYAIEMGIDVFSVPGAPYDPKCDGNLYLLKDGAYLCRNASDVLEILDNSYKIKNDYKKETETFEKDIETFEKHYSIKDEILGLIGANPIQIFEVLNHLNNKSNGIEIIAELELEGLIKRLPDGRILRSI